MSQGLVDVGAPIVTGGASIDVMAQHGAPANEIFTRVAGICNGLGEVTSDRLKRQAILGEMLALV